MYLIVNDKLEPEVGHKWLLIEVRGLNGLELYLKGGNIDRQVI